MKTKIFIENRQNRLPVTKDLRLIIRAAVEATLIFEDLEKPAEVSVSIVGADEIHQLNKEHRNIDKETDVLSFPMYDGEYEEYDMSSGRLNLGDIVICADVAAKQARELEHSVGEEIAFLCIHSTLHLLGYDHETSGEDEEDMFARQRAIKEYMFG